MLAPRFYPRTRTASLVLALAAGTLCGGPLPTPAHAQPASDLAPASAPAAPSSTSPPSTSPAAPSSPTATDAPPARGERPGAVKLEPKPLRIEALGLTISLPLNAKAESDSFGKEASLRINGPDARWTVSVRIDESKRTEMTAPEVCEATLEQIFGVKDPQVGTVSDGGIRLRQLDKSLRINDLPAARFYVELKPESGRAGLIRGGTMIRIGPGRFGIFESLCTLPNFEKAQGEVETMIATARFTDEAALNANRRVVIEAGQRLLKELSADDYEAALAANKERWTRIYVPASTGRDSDARELGYQRVRAWKGRRGEIDPARPADKFSGIENEPGYLVRVDARVLGGDDAGLIIDTQAIFYMSLDRSREAWTVTTVRRDRTSAAGKPAKPVVATEIGAREGDQLTITSAKQGEMGRPLAVPPQGYISRVEALLLPYLLVRKQVQTEVGFYAYKSEDRLIRLRRDLLARPADSDALWLITTRLTEDALPVTARYRNDGSLLRVSLEESGVLEPTELTQLLKLWKDKGLPTD